MKEVARTLRKRQTPQEKTMWQYLRNRKLSGKKFLRQHPITFTLDNRERFFIADFYCAELNLVIELDGCIHNNTKEYDFFRDNIISLKGLRVLRFTNSEIENNLFQVIEKIKSLVDNSSLSANADFPSL